jgi:toxin-antitoxin system PIN domain toxin
MTGSPNCYYFPDVNFWLALSYEAHKHHIIVRRWFQSLDASARVYFCRVTQVGLLRLLTTAAVMGDDEALTQPEAWIAYDKLAEDVRIRFLPEPEVIDPEFRDASQLPQPACKAWSDQYLIAFARSAGLRLITLDKSMAKKSTNVELLH